jgi:hypothetical protein
MKVSIIHSWEPPRVPHPAIGGRYTPFMSNYRPQLFLRTADITVALTFPEGTPDAAEKMARLFLLSFY